MVAMLQMTRTRRCAWCVHVCVCVWGVARVPLEYIKNCFFLNVSFLIKVKFDIKI